MLALLVKHGGLSKVPTIRTVQRLAEVIVVDDEPGTCDSVEFVRPNVISADEVTKVVRRLPRVPDGIFTFVDPVIHVATDVADQLGLPALSPRTVSRLKNKLLMREALLAAGVDYPKFTSFGDEEALPQLAEHIGFPVVLKPATGGAYSLGVARIDRPGDLLNTFRGARSQLENSEFSRYLRGGQAVTWMLEAYMAGLEVSVELLGQQGDAEVVAIHEKWITERNGCFREDCFVTAPCRLSERDVAIVRESAVNVARVLGFDRGVAHLEMRVTKNGVFPIELQAVPGGAMISQLTEWSRGANLHELHARSFLSPHRPKPPDYMPTQPCAMHVIYADEPGVYNIYGIEAARASPGILAVEVPVTKAVRVVQPFSEYLGFIVSRATTSGEAVRVIEESRQQLRLEQVA